jgi:hypothetical protein
MTARTKGGAVVLNQSPYDEHSNRSDQSIGARRAAEALFSPRIESPAAEAAPVDPAVRRPRILAVAATVPAAQDEPETPLHANPARQLAIPAGHIARIRIWLKHGITDAQVAGMYGITTGEVERALGVP